MLSTHEATLEHQPVLAIDGALGTQLREQERQDVLGLPCNELSAQGRHPMPRRSKANPMQPRQRQGPDASGGSIVSGVDAWSCTVLFPETAARSQQGRIS